MMVVGKIHFPEGSVQLHLDGTWHAEDSDLQSQADLAAQLARMPGFAYSPADGAYGVALLQRLARELAGTAEILYVEQSRPGVIY